MKHWKDWKTWQRELLKFLLTIIALVIIWETGLIIPFAIVGGLSAGWIKCIHTFIDFNNFLGCPACVVTMRAGLFIRLVPPAVFG